MACIFVPVNSQPKEEAPAIFALPSVTRKWGLLVIGILGALVPPLLINRFFVLCFFCLIYSTLFLQFCYVALLKVSLLFLAMYISTSVFCFSLE